MQFEVFAKVWEERERKKWFPFVRWGNKLKKLLKALSKISASKRVRDGKCIKCANIFCGILNSRMFEKCWHTHACN